MKHNLKVFIDGACQPNPGSGGVGIYMTYNDIEEKISSPLEGIVTNNIAEYEALIFSLETIIKKNESFERIDIFSDSQLICMQFNKKWKCKEQNLS
ncbi:ribonuclease HI family protein, partial [bacterium]|nr:ribonuclease HI family protein [bacterium]